MKLDLARELKTQLIEHVLPSLTTREVVRTLGVEARPLNTLRGHPATLALGIAYKKKKDFAIAVRVQDRALESDPRIDAIRSLARGEVDVRYIGRIDKQPVRRDKRTRLDWHQKRNRPLRMGGSIGHFRITAGSLACFVRDADGATYVLSNNHVLADENRGRPGDPILQPGATDGGTTPGDVVANLARWVTLDPSAPNRVDAAMALLSPGIRYSPKHIPGVGRLSGLAGDFLDYGAPVKKVGRTTGLTDGKVTAIEVDNVVVAYGIGKLRFDGQIEIESAQAGPCSRGGDSGSLIVNADRQGVGLLFAGSDQGGSNGMGLTYANPLGAVMGELEVDLLH